MDTSRDDTQNQNAQHEAQKQQAENQQREQQQAQEKQAAERSQMQVAESYRKQHEENRTHYQSQVMKEQNQKPAVTSHVKQEAKSTGDAQFGKSEWTSKGEVMRAAQSTRYIGYEATRNQTLKTLPNEQARAAVLSRHAAAARAPAQPARGRGR